MYNFFKDVYKEFRDFALKGNVVDLAVGIIIGGAFGRIVSSLVTDIIMPPFGLILGKIDFSKMTWVLQPASSDTQAITLNYGMFINNVMNFLIVSFVMFLLVKQMNRFKDRKKENEPAPTPPPPKDSAQLRVLKEIRDLLKKPKSKKV